jgi:transcriptional accessory protein Tex/SPT6
MTNQERPVEEQEELRGNGAAGEHIAGASQASPRAAVAEAAQETAGDAARDEPAPPAEATPAEPVAGTALTADAAPGEPAAPARPEAQAEPAVTDAPAITVTGGPLNEAEPVETAGATERVPPPEATATAVASGEADQERAVGAPAAAAPAADTPAETTPDVAPAAGAPTADASAEASYTPVEEDGKPRRVKDLQPGMELEGRVTSIALYGIFVDIGVGRDGLVHISEMSDTRIDSPSDIVKIGDTVKVRVKSVEPDGRRISLTMRSKERSEPRGPRRPKKVELNRELLASLRVGDMVEGTVTGIAPFGVFVDIGVGKDGLVHISELAEGRVEKAEDAVQVGQKYTFKLLEVDAAGSRISLSLRRAEREHRMQTLEKGQIIEGTVSGLAPFGAFVDIGVGRDGLIHISELSDQRVARVEDAVQVGDKVTVRVLGVDPQSKRISLSRRLEDRPREQPESVRPERGPRPERTERGSRPERASSPPLGETTRAEADAADEEPVGNATLEDLLSKYGGSGRNERRRRYDDDDDEDDDRISRRQREALRRTLQQLNDDE